MRTTSKDPIQVDMNVMSYCTNIQNTMLNKYKVDILQPDSENLT